MELTSGWKFTMMLEELMKEPREKAEGTKLKNVSQGFSAKQGRPWPVLMLKPDGLNICHTGLVPSST